VKNKKEKKIIKKVRFHDDEPADRSSFTDDEDDSDY
jgi:hypothetical protein